VKTKDAEPVVQVCWRGLVDTAFLARQQSVSMRNLCCFILLLLCVAGGYAQTNSYLFVWAGDDTKKSNDFIAVLDADASSPRPAFRWVGTFCLVRSRV
jgi:hypothetical protein